MSGEQQDRQTQVLADDGYCFGCGPGNPIGLRLEFEWDAATGDYRTNYTPAREHQGWVGRAHGGLIALVFDEVLSRVVLMRRDPNWVTAELTTRMVRPAVIGEPLIFRARIVTERSRLVITEGEAVTIAGIVIATGRAKMLRPARVAINDEGKQSMSPEEQETPLEQAAEELPEDAIPAEVRDAPAPVAVFSAGTEMEAQIVRGVLEDAGVPVYGQEVAMASFGNILEMGESRYGDIYVAPEDAERAQAAIAAAQQDATRTGETIDP